MRYSSDFTLFISFSKGDEVSFEQIQKKIFASGATWKDNTRDIISLRGRNIAFEITQEDGILTVSFRDRNNVSDLYGNTFNGDIILSPKEFVAFWENPEAFFPKLNEEEKDFFKNIVWDNNKGERILSLYTLRTGLSLKRAKQARIFNGMATRRQAAKESCEKQKRYSDLLEETIRQRSRR